MHCVNKEAFFQKLKKKILMDFSDQKKPQKTQKPTEPL